MTPLVLPAEQIESMTEFSKEDGQPFYMITRATIPEFLVEDGSIVPEYTGLIAYSDSVEHGVLQLGE